jgi:hypothetical protein
MNDMVKSIRSYDVTSNTETAQFCEQ